MSGPMRPSAVMNPTMTRPQMSLPDQRGSRCLTPARRDRDVAMVAVDCSTATSSRAASLTACTAAGEPKGVSRTSSGSVVSTGSAIVSHSGIDQSVEEVHDEVGDQHGQGDHEEDTLHQRIVEALDRLEQELPDAGIAEHLLHDHRAR